MKVEGSKVINTLANWGSNPGEFEEIVSELSQDAENCILAAEAKVYADREMISYQLTLTNRGVERYYAWCAEHGYHPNLQGKENILIFDDQDEESVRNTLEEWGM